MMNEIALGDILSVESINTPILVVSKTYFNRTEQIIACPVLKTASANPLHIPIIARDMQGGIVLCEQMKLLDLRVRGYKKLSELKMEDVMNITDAIQSIFDYYSFGK